MGISIPLSTQPAFTKPLVAGIIWELKGDTMAQDASADAYYGDDDVTDEELDLSFLDETEDQDEKKSDTPA